MQQEPVLHDRRKSDRTHRRTVFMAIVAAGIVSLFFGYANDHDACERIQDDRRGTASFLEERADPILGNPELKIPPANFEEKPFSSFKDFRDLIVANAQNDRKRAQAIRARIRNENCGPLAVFQ